MDHRIRQIGLLFLIFSLSHLPFSNGQGVLNSMPSSIELSIDNRNAYTNGVVQSHANQLSTSSNLSISLLSTLTLSVQATSTLQNGSHEIPLSEVTISVTEVKVGLNVLSNKNNMPATLSQEPQQLFGLKTTLGVSGTMYLSMQYELNGGIGLLQHAPGVYTTTLQFDLFLPLTGGIGTHYLGTVPLHIALFPVATMVFTNEASGAELSFTSVTDYKYGTAVVQGKAMNVFSTAPYNVNVSASSNLENGLSTIPIGNIYVKTIPDPPSTAINTAEIGLSLTPQTIISVEKPTIDQDYNVRYFTLPNNPAFLNRSAGTYSTTLIYTLTAP